MEAIKRDLMWGFCCLIFFAGCSPSPSEQRGIRQGDTQLVAQWLGDGSFWDNLIWTFTVEDRVTAKCGTICFVDGNDIGSGTRNLYIYAQPDDVNKMINILVALQQQSRLPSGMRIGVAKYKDSKHTDWTYEAVFPKNLRYFDITYSETGPHTP